MLETKKIFIGGNSCCGASWNMLHNNEEYFRGNFNFNILSRNEECHFADVTTHFWSRDLHQKPFLRSFQLRCVFVESYESSSKVINTFDVRNCLVISNRLRNKDVCLAKVHLVEMLSIDKIIIERKGEISNDFFDKAPATSAFIISFIHGRRNENFIFRYN